MIKALSKLNSTIPVLNEISNIAFRVIGVGEYSSTIMTQEEIIKLGSSTDIEK
jgi:hypothetical protein